MIRVLILLGLLAACAPTPAELPENFDSSFDF